MPNVSELDAHIDESIRRSVAAGYRPTTFMQMRDRHGTVKAMERLVVSGDMQSGFLKLRDLNMLEWTIEEAILKFPSIFGQRFREAAQFRLDRAKSGEF